MSCWRSRTMCVLLLPATPETDNFINAERLAKMKQALGY